MKNASTFLLLCIAICKLNAQVILANDSACTNASNTEMVFYNLLSGQKTIASNTDWHLALSMRPSLFPTNTMQGTTLRINESFGVNVYQIPNFTADSFNVAVDTAGYQTWNHLHDSDTALDFGALNNGYNIGVFNYGWGVYNGTPNHDVVGRKVYLFTLPDGSFKKFIVAQLDRDTAWDVKYANLDNSNLQTVHIGKSTYAGKNFVYLNLLDNIVHDKEPLSAQWDLQFMKYSATDIIPNSTYSAVGVLTNKGETVAEANAVDAYAIDNAGSNDYATNMSAIGWDWKTYDQQIHVYTIRDSLAYFVKTNSGILFKIVFTGYDVSSGMIGFYKQEYTTGIAKTDNEMSVQIFPNPASAVVNIITANNVESEIKVMDINGRLVSSTLSSSPTSQLSTAELENGVYLLSISSGKSTAQRKFVVGR